MTPLQPPEAGRSPLSAPGPQDGTPSSSQSPPPAPCLRERPAPAALPWAPGSLFSPFVGFLSAPRLPGALGLSPLSFSLLCLHASPSGLLSPHADHSTSACPARPPHPAPQAPDLCVRLPPDIPFPCPVVIPTLLVPSDPHLMCPTHIATERWALLPSSLIR